MKYIVLTLLFFLPINLEAQVLPYAKEVVQKLASEEFKGRGYVQDGDKIAANFIRDEFIRLGLKSFGDSYLQPFHVPVNTFPGAVSLSINGRELQPGIDFLVNPASASLKGTFEAKTFSNQELKKGMPRSYYSLNKDQFMVIDTLNSVDFTKQEKDNLNKIHQFLTYNTYTNTPNTIFLTNEKLTWSGSQMATRHATFTVVSDSITRPIDTIEVDLDATFYEEYPSQNIVGYILGAQEDSVILLMAHYDHFGYMGKDALFPGANDNASGVAMLLSLAGYYSQNQPEYTMVFAAFGAEEIGLVGSEYFAKSPLYDLSKTKFLLNFDLSGTGDEGIQVVDGATYREQFETLVELNEEFSFLPEVKIRGKACNSDHCSFYENDIPGFYIYTLGGIRAYHDVFDRYETLPFTEFEDYFSLMVKFIETL